MDHDTRLRRAAVLVLPYAAIALVYGTLFAMWSGRLPEEVAIHFNGMTADGYSSQAGMVWPALAVLVGMGALFGAMQYFGRMPLEARRLVYPVSYGCAALMGYLFIGTLVLQLDLESARGVALSGRHMVAGAVVVLLAGFIGFRLAALGPQDPAPEPGERSGVAPRLSMSPGQQASWTRTVGTTGLGLLVVGSVLLAAVLAAALGAWLAALPSLLFGLLPLAFLSLRVTVDRRGVRIGSGVLAGVGKTIPLERIEGARSQRISPMKDFQGWGYRVRAGRSGLVTRAGEALTVELVGGREFVVTVDDSRTAAALLNTLVDGK
ncbi:DUF1648 domain-containing protein [Streptomyces sp. XM4193]|uniref:DUF1648 domain-containing protein n=1 Tax=Streptomyces sp. XM4193 TaxID=2929782 RepID=UPI001FFB974D|nr:DUF1648 domain-containing protein [Streptomyces sp. XM4193]MCK1797075.1 DUF1648 domain-containing protein [Streptomyces sp. XM4193]